MFMETILQTTNLSRQFGKKMAVNNVNMTIHKGDIYGFIGKNGAGKTTFMRLVLGTAFPTKGEIKLFDGEPFDKARRKIGSLIEAPGLYKNCTAYENLKQFSLVQYLPATLRLYWLYFFPSLYAATTPMAL